MKKVILSLVIAFILLGSIVFSHPHTFMESKIKVIFDDKGMSGVQVNWLFDEMFSSIIYEYDLDGNSKFSKAELAEIEEGAFSNLVEYEYFTKMKVNKRDFIVKKVKDFTVNPKGKKVEYQFVIPCSVVADSKSDSEVSVSMFDETYYVDINPSEENPVAYASGSDFIKKYKIKEDSKKAFYYGQIVPQEVVVSFRRK